MSSLTYDSFDIYANVIAEGIEYELGELEQFKLSIDLDLNATCYFGFHYSKIYGLIKNYEISVIILIFHRKNAIFSWKIHPNSYKYIGNDDECVYVKTEFHMVKNVKIE